MSFFLSINSIVAQELFQQSNIELDTKLQNDKTYLCQATTSIKLLPGFAYTPTKGNNMSLEIDRYSVFPPNDGYCGGDQFNDEGGVVGTLSGDFAVSNSGGAIYSIDIQLPSAIGTMMPQLALVYNNQSFNGIAGWGWDLSGLSSISRVGKIELHDLTVTNVDFVNDRFSLDGQRLIAEDYSSYGNNGTVYRTEIDNMDRIVSYTSNSDGPLYFKVWRNDGTIWEYGSTNDSRLESSKNSKIILKWSLSKISDRNGNAVVFKYNKNVNTGELYIDNIEYTMNEQMKVSPAYKVEFKYDNDRKDAWSGYIHSNIVSVKKILKNIIVKNNYTKKELFNYSLEYNTPTYSGNHHFLHYRLKSVCLTMDDKKLNPTKIIWNSSKNHYPQSNSFVTHELNKTVFSELPFAGDFNGDGFSDVMLIPYKLQNTYPSQVTAKVYLNNGDGTFGSKPYTTLNLNPNLDWIYVIDLDNDGIDDIVSYDLNYNSNKDIVTLRFYLMNNNSFVLKNTSTYDNNVQLLPGCFEPNKNGVIVLDAYNGTTNNNQAYYFYSENGFVDKKVIEDSFVINGKEADHLAVDMSGNGICEILSLYKSDYKLFRLKVINKGSRFSLEQYASGNTMNKEIYPFPNDYNGDGKVDMLYYDPKTYWNMSISAGDNFLQPRQIVDNMLRMITLGPKDKYRCSLREIEEPSVTIRTSDFDGDGIADVGVFRNYAGNHFLEIGFLPYQTSDNKYNFVCQKRYYMPINYSHQTICVGRFLAQENVSVLSSLPRQPLSSEKAYIASLYPHSSYYSVERIVDGLGNVRGFSYDFLMDKLNAKNEFYSSDHNDLYYNIQTRSIPMAALKSDTMFNINDKAVITKYEYKNALIHTQGHGFLGFERIVTRNYIENSLIQKQLKEFEYTTMNNHAIVLPYSQKLYHGENQLVKEVVFNFKKYEFLDNYRIVLPSLCKKQEINYDFDRQSVIMSSIALLNDYQTDTGDDVFYDRIISLNSTLTGYDTQKISDPKYCQFWDEVSYTYDNNFNDWIINRPKKIKTSSHLKSGDSKGNIKIIEYADNNNPLRITKETVIPNLTENMSDPLVVTAEYQYDKVGNVIQESITSPSISQKKVLKKEFGGEYQYRYPTKTIDEFGNVTQCQYDTDYGILYSTIDHNQYVTINENEPIGVTDVVKLPDGTQTAKALRWSKSNEYAPQNASYYSWDKTTANAESLIFYHKSGVELRTVNFDLKGRPVFIDKDYDDYGNLKQESMPYYQGDVKRYVTYNYDKYNRLVKKNNPNASFTAITYDGNKVKTEFVSSEGVKQGKIDVYNAKEWLVSTIDPIGNEVKYDYYSDGQLKSAQIGNNTKTKISITYDNCGNKKTLYDPNHGLITYENDALGNIKKIISPNNNYIEYQYDVSGRLIVRKEKDAATNKLTTTYWQYSMEKGKVGLLSKVYNSDNHQLTYVYDDDLRLIKQKEIINGQEYLTSYSYDPAGRVATINYPTGFSILKSYSNSGYETACYDNDSKVMLWKTNETNANGNVLDYQLGNGSRTMQSFDNNTFMLESIKTTVNNKTIQNLSYKYDDYGNLEYRRKGTGVAVTEEFEYDESNRLLKIRLNGTTTGEMLYDELGNIVGKSINGVKVLYNTMYNGDKPHALVKADTDEERLFDGFKQNITYSTNDNAVKITDTNKNLNISYGCNQDRIFMSANVNGKTKTKTYIGDCEIVNDNGKLSKLTYISGPVGTCAVSVIDANGNKTINYVYKDNINSWNIITDEDGNILQDVSFDAWGNSRDSDTWTAFTSDNNIMFDRGFTGHEHLTDFGLINMNGRMYDPLMSMMLSPDNNIQMPNMSQNFNRYSYCLNNPLKYYDPTGEWVESVLTGIFSGFGNVISNINKIDNWGEGILSFSVGFAQGFLKMAFADLAWLHNALIGSGIVSIKNSVNEIVAISDGSFKLSGNDWNKIYKSFAYGVGSGFFTYLMKSYITFHNEETGEHGQNTSDFLFVTPEVGHAFTAVVSHSLGSWFSGQPFFKTMKLKNVGLDLEMLSIVAKRLLTMYIVKTDFAYKAIEGRALEIGRMLGDYARQDIPEHPDMETVFDLSYVLIDYWHVYVVGNIYAKIPAERILPFYAKFYLDEMVAFPFSFSLLRSIFF